MSEFIQYAKLHKSNAKLICIPFAGSGASYYIPWVKRFQAQLDVLPIQLAGRENRSAEPFAESLDTLAEAIADEVSPLLNDVPFGIFGHSMGGLIGFLLTRALEQRGLRAKICFISATAFEHYPEESRSKYLSEAAFIQRVENYGAVSKEDVVFQNPVLKEMALRILRADFDLIERYEYSGDTICTPMIALCGDSDRSISLEHMHIWEKSTTGGIRYHSFPGDHFYLNANMDELSSLILREML